MNPASCETVRPYLLSAGWNAGQRREAIEMLTHAEQCPQCRAALGDFDRIRAALASAETSDAAEPAGGWEAMRWRMQDVVAPHMPTRGAAAAAARPQMLRPSLAVAAAMAIAASAAFQIGRSLTHVHEAPMTTAVPVYLVDPQRVEPGPTISPKEESHEIEAFRQVAGVYDGRAGWMMVSNSSDASDVGVLPSAVEASQKVLLLRLDLWHGQELVSNADLLVLAGQTADLTVPLENSQSLHYHISTSADPVSNEPAQLYLALELKSPTAHNPLAALATHLQLHPNQKVTAGRLTTSAGEYELKIDFKESDLTEKSR